MRRDRMKKLACIISFACLLVLGLVVDTTFAANKQLKIYVNLQLMDLDVGPQVVQERILVPVRGISEMVGSVVEWKEDTKQIIVYTPGEKEPYLTFTLNHPQVLITLHPCQDGNVSTQTEILDVAPIEINGRTMVPLRFIAEKLGYDVTYDGEKGEIHLQQPSEESFF